MRGDRLRGVREHAGLTQKELGERLGISDKQLIRWENNKNQPTAEILAKIAQELNVSSDYLLGLSDSAIADLNESDLTPGEKKMINACSPYTATGGCTFWIERLCR